MWSKPCYRIECEQCKKVKIQPFQSKSSGACGSLTSLSVGNRSWSSKTVSSPFRNVSGIWKAREKWITRSHLQPSVVLMNIMLYYRQVSWSMKCIREENCILEQCDTDGFSNPTNISEGDLTVCLLLLTQWFQHKNVTFKKYVILHFLSFCLSLRFMVELPNLSLHQSYNNFLFSICHQFRQLCCYKMHCTNTMSGLFLTLTWCLPA